MKEIEFISEKQYLSWLHYNENNLEIINRGRSEGLYKIKYKIPKEFVYIVNEPLMFDKFPIHR